MAAQDFYNQVYRDARSIGANHVQAAVAAAQSAIETGWGASVKGNAYFGIKAGPSWKGKTVTFTTHEVVNGRRVKIDAKFRAYDSFADSVRDHLETIKAKWPKAYAGKTIDAAAAGLMNGVHGAYATDPDYANKVIATAGKRAEAARKAYEGGGTAKSPATPAPAKAQPKPDNPKSALLPLFRPKQAGAVVRAWLDGSAGLTPAERRGDKVRVLMVRGYYLDSMGAKGKNDRAIYDDAVFVVSPEGVQPFNGNSDPAVFRKRVATLKAPQAVRYVPGKHGLSRKDGGYPAFRQDSDVTVVRDGAGDDRDSARNRFWINLHKGAIGGTSSLGCLTIPPHQWDEFRDLVYGLLKKHGQRTFYVTLLEYPRDIPAVEPASPQPAEVPAPKPQTPSPVAPAKPAPKASIAARLLALIVGGALLAAGWLLSKVLP